MAGGGESAQERTEQASPKRLEDARRKADVPRSRELVTAVMLLAGLGGLAAFGVTGARAYRAMATRQWTIERAQLFDDASLLEGLRVPLLQALGIIAPFLAVMFGAALFGSMLVSGWVFSVEALKPDLSRMNPLKGIGRMFGIKALGELGKGLLKVLLVGAVGWLVLRANVPGYVALGRAPLGSALVGAFTLLFGMLCALTLVIAAIAAIDVPWQRFQHAKKLRMTRQEVREESRESHGNPELKAKVRSLQQSISQRRMLRDIVDADVVIVNPTHYAVALRYAAEESAPVVVASGVDHMAMRIREIGREHGVATFSAPPLARALYHHAPVGSVIPAGLYVAVAQVLAHVYRAREGGLAARVPPPDNFPIPPALREEPYRGTR